jgi:dihydroorotate dehydrogenase (NAD+) catalytic subunit
MVNLSVEIGSVRLANPVMPASGTFSEDLGRAIDFNRLGALVPKSISRGFRAGNPPPRIAETRDGMLNSIGIPSRGVDHFVEHTVPFYKSFSPPLVASIFAETDDDFVHLCRAVTVPGVDVIEANVSCPNIKANGEAVAMGPEGTEAVMAKLRKATDLPLWAKLTPNTSDIAAVARGAEAGGAEAVVVANTILAMAIDSETWEPRLGSVMGGLSGPAVKPIILRMVYQCARAVAIPVIGCGGIATAEDAVEYMLAGASAVQVGTANFIHPTAMITIIDDLGAYCERRGLARISDLIGAVRDDSGRTEVP